MLGKSVKYPEEPSPEKNCSTQNLKDIKTLFPKYNECKLQQFSIINKTII